MDLAWRTVYRLGFPLARLWWGLIGACHEGALVAVYVGSALLLLRSSYRTAWNFPGGGIRRGERPDEAARRELAEETGLRAGALRPAGVVRGRWEGRRDRVHVFELRLDRLPELILDNREIIAARLVMPDELAETDVTGPVAAYVAACGLEGAKLNDDRINATIDYGARMRTVQDHLPGCLGRP